MVLLADSSHSTAVRYELVLVLVRIGDARFKPGAWAALGQRLTEDKFTVTNRPALPGRNRLVVTNVKLAGPLRSYPWGEHDTCFWFACF